MTNDEIQIAKEIRNSDDGPFVLWLASPSGFELRHSFVIRHSSVVIFL